MGLATMPLRYYGTMAYGLWPLRPKVIPKEANWQGARAKAAQKNNNLRHISGTAPAAEIMRSSLVAPFLFQRVLNFEMALACLANFSTSPISFFIAGSSRSDACWRTSEGPGTSHEGSFSTAVDIASGDEGVRQSLASHMLSEHIQQPKRPQPPWDIWQKRPWNMEWVTSRGHELGRWG